jgi:hypothetical protein
MRIYAVDGAGAESWLVDVSFDVRGGPNGVHCKNGGLIVDDKQGTSFACDQVAIEGDNCEIITAEAAAKKAEATAKQESAENLAKAEASAADATASLAVAEATTALSKERLREVEVALNETETQKSLTKEANNNAAAQSSKAEEDKKQTAFTTGLAAGGAIVLILLIIAAVKYQQHRIAMRLVDFASVFVKMVDQLWIRVISPLSRCTCWPPIRVNPPTSLHDRQPATRNPTPMHHQE